MNTSLFPLISLSPRVVQLLASSEIKLVSIVLGVFSLLVFLATIFLEQQIIALWNTEFCAASISVWAWFLFLSYLPSFKIMRRTESESKPISLHRTLLKFQFELFDQVSGIGYVEIHRWFEFKDVVYWSLVAEKNPPRFHPFLQVAVRKWLGSSRWRIR